MGGLSRGTAGMSGSLNAANSNIRNGNNSLLNMVKSIGGATLALGGLTAMAGGITGLAVALTGAADKATLMTAKLRIATRSQAEFAQASADVRAIANGTRSDLGAVTALYSKMSANASNLGLNTAGVATATRTFGMALKVSGASAQEAESSILQLGQAMASGVLNGDEFKSLAENSPVFMGILADSMNVPKAALKKLGAEGKITGEQIAKALTDPKIVAGIEAQFGKIPVTFADIKTGIGNTMVEIAGALAKGLGIDSSLAVMLASIQNFAKSSLPFFTMLGQKIRETFMVLAPVIRGVWAGVAPILGLIVNNMDTIVQVALAVGAAFVVMKASMGLSNVIGEVIKLGVSMGASGGFAAFFTGAVGTATGAVNTFTAALALNPVTAILVGLTAVIALLVQFSDKIKLPGQEFGRLNDIVAVWWRETKRAFMDIVNGVVTLGTNIRKVFDAFAVIGRSVFASVLAVARNAFSGIINVGRNVFNLLNAATGGFLGKAISVFRGVMAWGKQAFDWLSDNWSKLPGMLGGFVMGAVEWVISGVEKMANGAIDGLNKIIEVAKNLPGGEKLSTIDHITIKRPDFGVADRIGRDAEYRGLQRYSRDRHTDAPPADNNTDNNNNNGGGGGSPAAGGAADKLNDAAEAAKRMREAVDGFWNGLTESRDAAGLVGFELEKHNAILEYRKILGDGELANARALTEAETQRIDNLLTEKATRQAVATLTEQNTELARQSALVNQESALLQTMTTDQAKAEMDVRTKMDGFRRQFLIDHADANDAALASALAQHEAALRQLAVDQERLKIAQEQEKIATDLIARYTREADPVGYARSQRETRDAAITSGRGRPEGMADAEWQRVMTMALGRSADEFESDLNDISKEFHDRMTSAITQIGDAIGGEWGAAINKVGQAIAAMAAMARGDNSKGGLLGGIAELFGKDRNGELNDFGKSFAEGTKNIMSFSKEASSAGFKSLTKLFSGEGGFMKNLGSVLGRASGGAQVGSIVGGIGKMLNKNFSEKGAQIGGMIGSFIPIPGGSILGSIAGGIIGGLFGKKKAATASSTLSMGANGLVATTTGNNSAAEGEAGQASAKVMEGITAIAARLGVDATGMANVSIGKYKNEWKVGTNGQAVGKKSGQSFGDDAEAAIRFAIQDAIRDGVLIGLSSFSDRLLKSASNLDSALSLAESYEKLLKDLGNLKDPLGASIKSVTDSLDKMVKMMTASGATADELAKVGEYRRLKLDDLLKSSLKDLNDFKADLSGEGSGVSAINRLMAAQSEFAKMDATIRGGGVVDQANFTKVGQDIMGLAREIYGTSSSQFQSIRQALIEATDGAINNVTEAFDDATVVAIDRQTDAITQNQTIQNDLLRQIAAGLANGGGNSRFTGDDGYAVNGRFYSNLA